MTDCVFFSSCSVFHIFVASFRALIRQPNIETLPSGRGAVLSSELHSTESSFSPSLVLFLGTPSRVLPALPLPATPHVVSPGDAQRQS